MIVRCPRRTTKEPDDADGHRVISSPDMFQYVSQIISSNRKDMGL